MKSFSISNLIPEFLISKEVEEGNSKSTVKAYEYDLKKLIEIIGDSNIELLTTTKIRIFIKFLKDKNYSKKGIARKIATLRSFLKFLVKNEFISKNPMDKISSPKIRMEESLPKYLELDEIGKILEMIKDKNIFNSKKSQRFYLLVRLLYATMARVSEISNIKIKDVNFQEGFIHLRGKGNKERIVPVDKNSLMVIKNYLENRFSYSEEDYLLVNTRNLKLSPRVIQEDIKVIKEKCGFSQSKQITPHIFRHTGATHLRRAGMDISELQDILGHSSSNTTRIYAKNDIRNLKKSYDGMHPLSLKKDLRINN
ncbi:MAG: tyrosine-type recombinase/integrase [Candidatus Lokiarchaeota archaeon]|nr:tyrosine-type recombinase/integrase [Candidatus Lokiarchaeota archaeon]